MTTNTFHIQGRLVKREMQRIVRDETRLADTDTRDEAFRIARDMVHAGFTVWIWQDTELPNGRVGLALVERIRPDARPNSAMQVTTSGRRRPLTQVRNEHAA